MNALIKKGFEIYNKYNMPILYLCFGGLTTLTNITIYFISYNLFRISNVPSTIIAWIFSVVFAFIANKIYVFKSKSKAILYEIIKFFACRIGTGMLDILIMYISVDLLNYNSLLMKLFSNIFVIILNYIFSKIIVFKKE